jgi:predicted AAA+ superfamily ATPase
MSTPTLGRFQKIHKKSLLYRDVSAKIRLHRILDGGAFMAYIKRTLEQKILEINEDYSCLLLIGPRQVGKTTMLEHLMEKTERQKVTLDDAENRRLAKSDPALFLEMHPAPVLIDEVQYAISKEELKNPENIKLYNVLNGLMRLRNVDIYVTGSNSKMLTKDVLTAFRGRGDEVKVYPISFNSSYFVKGDSKLVVTEVGADGKFNSVTMNVKTGNGTFSNKNTIVMNNYVYTNKEGYIEVFSLNKKIIEHTVRVEGEYFCPLYVSSN